MLVLGMAELEEGTKEDNLRASFWPVHPLIMLADVYRAVGKGSEAAETISRALNISNERAERGFEAWAMLVMAGIKNAANQSEEAKRWYERALRQATELSMRPLIAHCHRGLSESHLHIGNEKQAQLENETALELYHSLGMTYWQSTG